MQVLVVLVAVLLLPLVDTMPVPEDSYCSMPPKDEDQQAPVPGHHGHRPLVPVDGVMVE